MAETNRSQLQIHVVETEVTFTLAGLCQAGGSDRGFLLALVEEGVLQPSGTDPDNWQFSGQSLRAVRTAANLSRDLDLNPAGIALVLDLLERIDALTARLQRAGLR